MARCFAGVSIALVMAAALIPACGDDGSGGGGGGGSGGGSDADAQDSSSTDSGSPDSTDQDSSEKDATATDGPVNDTTTSPDADSGPVEDCANGTDDDGDQVVDCADTQCANSTACGELEKCDDNVDNDTDGFDDCNDSECSCAATCGGPSCPGGVAAPGTSAVNMPNTDGACHAYAGSCSLAASPERALSFTTTTAGQYYFSLTGLTAMAVLFIRQTDCNGAELACEVAPSFNGAAETVLTLAQNTTVVVFVESTGTNTGLFSLIVDKVP